MHDERIAARQVAGESEVPGPAVDDPEVAGEDAAVEQGQVTRLLFDLKEGKTAAEAQLFAMAYERLRRIAGGHVRRSGRMVTINPTALVSEAYVKLRPVTLADVQSSAHFYRIMSRAMRQVVIDMIRKRTAKHAIDRRMVTLDEHIPEVGMSTDDLLALDTALDKLESVNKDLAQLVEWRFYGGLDIDEIASLLGVTDRTVRRKWQLAKAMLADSLTR